MTNLPWVTEDSRNMIAIVGGNPLMDTGFKKTGVFGKIATVVNLVLLVLYT